MIGLITAIGSGFIVGKTGPNVHLASTIANQLMRFKWFKNIKDN